MASRHKLSTSAPKRGLRHRRLTATVGVLGTLAAIAVGGSAIPSNAANRHGAQASRSASPTASAVPSAASSASASARATTKPKVSTSRSATTSSATTLRAGLLLGSSFGGGSVASIHSTCARFPNSSLGRYYFPGNPSIYSSSALTAIPAHETIMVSFKTAVATVKSGAYDATFTSILRSWNASGRTIYWTWQHEADNPSKHIAPADYVAGWKHLLAVAAANPSPRVHSMSILMAYVLSPSHPHGDPAKWYVNSDVLGFDSYNLGSEKQAIAYAAAKGKRVAFPEFGDGIAGAPDAASLLFAKAFVGAFTSNVFGAAWFNALGTTLSRIPHTATFLNSIA